MNTTTPPDLSRKSAYRFDLPEELIAAHPAPERSASRMLVMDRESGRLVDRSFSDLVDFLRPDDVLVFNNTRVIKARLFGHKQTGGHVEILVERVDQGMALAQVKASKSPKPGSTLTVDGHAITVLGRDGMFFQLQFDGDWYALMDVAGHVPLPPYIDRADVADDIERYQTVYASKPGAVAAPTAGLHFDHSLLDALREAGIDRAEVTLHVGAGTYQPMRADALADHVMHIERYEVTDAAATRIRQAREQGGRVLAVGTTSVRTLESVARKHGDIVADQGSTDLFLHPGNAHFHVVDAMITNFHLSESTLLMLVSAFAGYSETLAAYRHAIEARYRFFSYGDGMLIL